MSAGGRPATFAVARFCGSWLAHALANISSQATFMNPASASARWIMQQSRLIASEARGGALVWRAVR